MSGPEIAAAFGGGLIGVGVGGLLMALHWYRSETGASESRDARIASLTASLDDAHREVSRLTGEKHARDTVIHEAIGVLERLHRQEAGT